MNSNPKRYKLFLLNNFQNELCLNLWGNDDANICTLDCNAHKYMHECMSSINLHTSGIIIILKFLFYRFCFIIHILFHIFSMDRVCVCVCSVFNVQCFVMRKITVFISSLSSNTVRRIGQQFHLLNGQMIHYTYVPCMIHFALVAQCSFHTDYRCFFFLSFSTH